MHKASLVQGSLTENSKFATSANCKDDGFRNT